MMKLLIGGSPCTHWSIAQTKNRETAPEGLGWELFKNYRIALEKFKPDFFLYENNKSMAPAIRAQITRELGVEPIEINSARVSAQNRKRLYWTNIPGVGQPEDKGILLRDILEAGAAWREKAYTLKANYTNAGAVNGVCGQHFPAPVAAEPVRIGTIESDAKNADFDSQQYRVYSTGGKSVTLCGNGGGVGAKTGLYAVPCDCDVVITEKSIRCQRRDKKHSTVQGSHVNFEDGKSQTLSVAHTPKVIEPIEYIPLQSCDVVAKTGLYAVRVRDGFVLSNSVAPRGKAYSVYAVREGRITIKGQQYPIKLADGFYIIRKLTVTECKRLQTVPEDYIFPVSDTQAYKMLGNGWTVDVIAHILSYCPGITTELVEVLSMYDGMSCGHIALNKIGASITKYYATETDKYAIKTTQHNFPDTIQLGDAFQVRDEGWSLPGPAAEETEGHMDYLAFLRSKIQLAPESGFDLAPEELAPALKPHQRAAVLWALKGGRRALFESFGLGKTVQQLEWCRQVVRREGGRALVVLPLGVRQEFRRDAAELLGMEPPAYIRTMAEAEAAPGSILLTNYERVRDGDIDPRRFTAVSLDEASVLRSFGSKTYQRFLDKFRGVRYKLVNTATPSPNRYKELIHYAGYLEVMDTGQAITRFFQRDSTKAGNLTLYPHKEDEFWLWVASWALVLTRPSDLGYDDEGYDLPPLEVRKHVVHGAYGQAVDRDGQIKLQNDAAVSLSEEAREKRESIAIRVDKAKEIVAEDPEAHFLLWHDLEAERHALIDAFPEAVDIYGAMDYEERERRVIGFSEGQYRLFATKKSLSGSGCNFQRHCHRAIFLGIDYEFNDFIQAVHRIYRFLQTEPVVIDIICTEAEDPVFRALMAKWEQHEHLQGRMREIVKKYGLSRDAAALVMARSIGVDRVEIKGEHWTAVNSDCVEETAKMPENSVDLIVTSIPFSKRSWPA